MAKASPHQIAMYGHIATLIREYLKKEGIGVAEMNSRLGIARTSTVLYGLTLNLTDEEYDRLLLCVTWTLNVNRDYLKWNPNDKNTVLQITMLTHIYKQLEKQ